MQVSSFHSFLPFLSRNVSNTLSCRPLLPRKMLRNLPFLLLGTSYSSFSLYIQTVLFRFYPEALLEISFEILRLYLHYNLFVWKFCDSSKTDKLIICKAIMTYTHSLKKYPVNPIVMAYRADIYLSRDCLMRCRWRLAWIYIGCLVTRRTTATRDSLIICSCCHSRWKVLPEERIQE